MKVSDFEAINRNTPLYMPRYKIIKIPKWVDSYKPIVIMKGDYYLYHTNGVMIHEKSGSSIRPYATMFKFVGYVRVKELPYGNFVVIK